MENRKIFVHVCCAPCAVYPVKMMQEEGLSLTGFFYNPNIHPLKEFKKRKETLREWAAKTAKVKMIWDESYPLEEWLFRAVTTDKNRCQECYLDRMIVTAQKAKELGFTEFTTTLLASTHQKHEWVKEAGEEAARQTGIGFYYQDWRTGWPWADQTTRESGMYRQGYCGCVLSERDRYQKKKID